MKAYVFSGFAVSMMVGLGACGGHVTLEGLVGGSGGSCPAATPGQCLPSACVDGVQRTGQANCENGAWVCVEVACSASTGSGGGGTGGAPCTAGSIEASSYDQSCTTDGDCAAVHQGSFCDACFCPNGAIAQDALAKYQADFAAGSKGTGACPCPATPGPVCHGGVCVILPP